MASPSGETRECLHAVCTYTNYQRADILNKGLTSYMHELARQAFDFKSLIPQLLAGSCQELRVEAEDFNMVVVVANENDIALKPFHQGLRYMEDLAGEFKPKDALNNPEPYIEFQFQADDLLMHPHTSSQARNARDVKGSSSDMDGYSPASLYQVASYGSCSGSPFPIETSCTSTTSILWNLTSSMRELLVLHRISTRSSSIIGTPT